MALMAKFSNKFKLAMRQENGNKSFHSIHSMKRLLKQMAKANSWRIAHDDPAKDKVDEQLYHPINKISTISSNSQALFDCDRNDDNSPNVNVLYNRSTGLKSGSKRIQS